jgi:hypothetical protein
MGNLLGTPGQFYAHLTGETVRQGSRLGPLCRGAKQALGTFLRTLPRGSPKRRTFNDLAEELQRVRSQMEGQAYRAAAEGLYDIIRRLVLLAIDRECPDDVAMEYAFARDAKLGLGFWFVREIQPLMAKTTDPELLHTEALLALYFLSAYRLPPEGRGRPA